MRTRLMLPAGALFVAGLLIGLHTTTIGAQEKKADATPTSLPSPGWTKALPPGPDARVKITEAYARHVGSDAYFWSWPMVNIYNRRLHFAPVKEASRVGPL